MFTEAQKSAYRAVTAPPSLRERVLDMATEAPQPKKRPARRWMGAAVAACLVLVMTSALMPKHGTEILVGGNAVGNEPVAVERSGIALARAAETLVVPLTVKTHEDVALVPEHGVLRSGDTMIAARCEINSPAELTWEIENPDTAERYELRMTCGDEVTVLTLAFDAAENCWTVFAAQE